MAPKGTPKKAAAAAAEAKATPKKGDTSKKAEQKTPQKAAMKDESRTATPRNPKEATKFNKLNRTGATLPVDVSFAGDLTQAKLTKSGAFVHNLKLEAGAAFSLLKTYTITEGENEGQQVIVLKPARAFPFLKLEPVVRNRVYKFYFAAKGVVNGDIVFEGKRKGGTDIYAKAYAEGSKNRVAILAVNKEIHGESMPVFYGQPVKMDNTNILMDFLAMLGSPQKLLIQRLAIKTWQKTSARNALAFLAEAKNLKSLKFDAGVINEGDVPKAARSFWTDARKLLEAIGSQLEKTMVPDDEVDEASDEESEAEEDEADEEDADESQESSSENAESGDSANARTPEQKPTTPVEQAKVSEPDAGTLAASGKSATDIPAEDKMDTTEDTPQPATTVAPKAATNPKKPLKPTTLPPRTRQGRKSDAVAVIKFGKGALKMKNAKGDAVDWKDDMVVDFRAALRAKLE